jgi:death on curing protein
LSETQYLTLDDVIALHDEIVERMKSPHAPLLQLEKLESALARPRNAAWYAGADLVEQAVILAVGVSQSQAFLDGNKRAAFAAADVFLKINGLVFHGVPLDLARRLEAVAEGLDERFREAETDRFVGWLRGQVAPDSSYQ